MARLPRERVIHFHILAGAWGAIIWGGCSIAGGEIIFISWRLSVCWAGFSCCLFADTSRLRRSKRRSYGDAIAVPPHRALIHSSSQISDFSGRNFLARKSFSAQSFCEDIYGCEGTSEEARDKFPATSERKNQAQKWHGPHARGGAAIEIQERAPTAQGSVAGTCFQAGRPRRWRAPRPRTVAAAPRARAILLRRRHRHQTLPPRNRPGGSAHAQTETRPPRKKQRGQKKPPRVNNKSHFAGGGEDPPRLQNL